MDYPDHLRLCFEQGNSLRMQGYRGRYAPSPTGDLHLGNLRTALISWLRARICQGTWILRIDDLDTPRNRLGATEKVQADLLWLGLLWDGEVVFQSKRKGLYYSVLSALKSKGKVYACRCTRSYLLENSENTTSSAVYPGKCRDLKLLWGLEQGRLPGWRLRVSKEFSKKSGDVLLRRSDGFVAYHFANVVDDLTLGITEVVRGVDLLAALQSQLAIFKSLNQSPAKYLHAPLLVDSKGKKLSKRERSYGLDCLRLRGMDSPAAVIGYLASTLELVPYGSVVSAQELLSELKRKSDKFDSLLK